MKPAIEKRVREHGEKLNKIFNTGIEPLKLCRALRRIENEAHKLAEDACNFLDMESLEFQKRETRIKDRVASVLHETWGELDRMGVFINLDPRGYALKIQDEYVRQHNLDIHKDWGGYGILAPDLS